MHMYLVNRWFYTSLMVANFLPCIIINVLANNYIYILVYMYFQISNEYNKIEAVMVVSETYV